MTELASGALGIAEPVAAAAVSGIVIRRALPTEYHAIDRLVTEAYAHDYGPRTGGTDPMAKSENRDRDYEVWVAVESVGFGADAGGGAAGAGGAGAELASLADDAGAGGAAAIPSDVPATDGTVPGELLGSITLQAPGGPSLHEDFAADELDLRLLAVSPRARRRGIGAALMGQAAVRARAGGFAAVGLKTQPDMLGAHRLYESLGYQRAPERDGLWIGGRRVLDLYTYLLPLG